MKKLRALDNVIKCDYNEKITSRTHKILIDVGMISPFVEISSSHLKKLLKNSQADAGRFLCEIYRFLTGNYFENEGIS